MKRLEIQQVSRTFHIHQGRSVQQGEVWVGPELQGGILKSCVCIGFYSSEKAIGATSHITGFRPEGAHSTRGALALMRKGLRRFGLESSDCHCFLLGGADRARAVCDEAESTLRDEGIPFQPIDLLGAFHRKFLLDPASGVLSLYKLSDAEAAAKARNRYSADSSYSCFRDSRRRLITGASLFFRNGELLDAIARHALPALAGASKRLHVWCAGCSVGMETYSIAMLTLDWLKRRGLSANNLRLLGTDISESALDTARKGEYATHGRNVRVHADLFQTYTEPTDQGGTRVKPELARYTIFKQRDIRQGSRRHRFEIVVCDHVLQYFTPEVQMEMVRPLVQAIAPNGFAYIATPSTPVREAIPSEFGLQKIARDFYRKP